jgi:hypothetical protein
VWLSRCGERIEAEVGRPEDNSWLITNDYEKSATTATVMPLPISTPG